MGAMRRGLSTAHAQLPLSPDCKRSRGTVRSGLTAGGGFTWHFPTSLGPHPGGRQYLLASDPAARDRIVRPISICPESFQNFIYTQFNSICNISVTLIV